MLCIFEFSTFLQVPNVDDIVFDVPLDFMDSDIEEGGSGRFRKIRDVNGVNNVDNDVFRPLRIHLHYDRISIDK